MPQHRTRCVKISWVHIGLRAFLFVTALVCYTATTADAQTLSVLYAFTGGANGSMPSDGVIRDSAGNIYGTTLTGGNHNYGTVFKLTPAGVQTVLYSFTGGTDGAYPAGSLIRDAAGNLYGATGTGGILSCNSGTGCGTIFKIDSRGTETVLFSFTGGNGGQFPMGGLVRDSAGNFYGTTDSGGTSNAGTVFRLDKNNNLTVLYSFTGVTFGPDGGYPNGALVRDSSGNLYGTTYSGGTYNGGTVFKVDSSGNETILHSFSGTDDGAYPSAGVIRDGAGNLYGATRIFGASNAGTVFEVSAAGQTTVLYAFTGGSIGSNDGNGPDGGLVRDGVGNLYGLTVAGGEFGWGVIYRIDPTGKETTLHSFRGGRDGKIPTGSLTRDSKGRLYGVANQGGSGGQGNVFRLTP
jgi:uncharacterized repeat protein (TIGR03803 family)